MSHIRIKKLNIKNYRSFGNHEQTFEFPGPNYQKPVAIVGYNNAGKTNLINAILYTVGEKFVSENTLERADLHNLSFENCLHISSDIDASEYQYQYKDKRTGNIQNGTSSISGVHTLSTTFQDGDISAKVEPSFFGTSKHYNIFYVNFHKIKDEISTKKTSWGNMSSFLAKHIDKIIKDDTVMVARKANFKNDVKQATDKILRGEKGSDESRLFQFIQRIKKNYCNNLRNNACEIDFSLPDYEDIFLQMMFRIGLNGDTQNLVPIDHFGDGYISMFVMAVIQAIAESGIDDKCLFLFEEPESFLHENHQEYFYKMVLCKLAEKHQVIYTTHSDRMVDIFDTRGLIRLEFDEELKQTVKKYNNTNEITLLNPIIDNTDADEVEKTTLSMYNSYIKNIEPNLNKILFSRKVILVEGPNDLMAYKYAIEKKVCAAIASRDDIQDKLRYADTYLNFRNIAIIPHHGKTTALLLIRLCKHLKLDCFVINDWDFQQDFVASIHNEFEQIKHYTDGELGRDGQPMKEATIKGMITNNKNIINAASDPYYEQYQVHFNIPRLEKVIGYDSSDKDSLKIWQLLKGKKSTDFTKEFFPQTLENFLDIEYLDTF